MTAAAQFQTMSDVAVPVANDGPVGLPRASVCNIPPVSAIVAHRNGDAETMLFVEAGVIELVINGMEGYLGEGEFARIAPGAHFSYRNTGTTPATVLSVPLVRTGRPARTPSAA